MLLYISNRCSSLRVSHRRSAHFISVWLTHTVQLDNTYFVFFLSFWSIFHTFVRIDAAHYILVFAYFYICVFFSLERFARSHTHIFSGDSAFETRTFQPIVLITYKNWHSTSLGWEKIFEYWEKNREHWISWWCTWEWVRARVWAVSGNWNLFGHQNLKTSVLIADGLLVCPRLFFLFFFFWFRMLFSVANLPLIIMSIETNACIALTHSWIRICNTRKSLVGKCMSLLLTS